MKKVAIMKITHNALPKQQQQQQQTSTTTTNINNIEFSSKLVQQSMAMATTAPSDNERLNTNALVLGIVRVFRSYFSKTTISSSSSIRRARARVDS